MITLHCATGFTAVNCYRIVKISTIDSVAAGLRTLTLAPAIGWPKADF